MYCLGVRVCEYIDKHEQTQYKGEYLIRYFIHLLSGIKEVDNWYYPWPLLGTIIVYIPARVTLFTIGWLKWTHVRLKAQSWWEPRLNGWGGVWIKAQSKKILIVRSERWLLNRWTSRISSMTLWTGLCLELLWRLAVYKWWRCSKQWSVAYYLASRYLQM